MPPWLRGPARIRGPPRRNRIFPVPSVTYRNIRIKEHACRKNFPRLPLLILLPAAVAAESGPPVIRAAYRQKDAEDGTAPHGAPELDAAAMQLGDGFYD